MEVDEIINSFIIPGSLPDQILTRLRAVASDIIARANVKLTDVISEIQSVPPARISPSLSQEQIVGVFGEALTSIVATSNFETMKGLDLSIIQVRNLAGYMRDNPPKDPVAGLMNFKAELSGRVPLEIQPDVRVLLAQTTLGSFLALLSALITKINGIVPPVHPPVSLNDILAELSRFAALPDPLDRELLLLEYVPMIRDRVNIPAQAVKDRAALNAFITDMTFKLSIVNSITNPDLNLSPPPFKELFVPYATFRANYYVSRSDLQRQQSGIIYLAEIRKAVTGILPVVTPASLPTTASFLGFYGPDRDPTSRTFMLYVDEATDGLNVGPGWTVSGMQGINGKVTIVKFTSNVYSDVIVSPGPPAVSFPYVSNAVVMSDQPTETIAGSSLIRMEFVPPVTLFETDAKTTAHGFRGPLVTDKKFSVYVVDQFTGPMPDNGWKVTGFSDPSMLLVDVAGNITVTKFVSEPGTANVLTSTTTKSQQYMYRIDVVTDQQQMIPLPSSNVLLTFTRPGALIESKYYSLYDPKIFDADAIKGQTAELRDLNSNVLTSEGKEVYHTVVDRGSGTGALIALAAVGAQDKFLYGGESLWIPRIRQHTPFVINQRLSVPLRKGGSYLGNTVQVDIFPRETGDLISNMYLQCALPALASGYYYTELIGRAIIKKAEFIINGEVYETLTDDLYVILDQLTLDADEKLGMYKVVSNGTPEGSNVTATSQINLIVPLDFFFCRRFTHMRQNKKPFFPMCALVDSTVSVRFTFNTSAWITNSATPVDIINPRLLIDEITLSSEERMYYRSIPMNFRIPRLWKEAVQSFTNGVARINLTADFQVNMLVWFIRNKNYEQDNRLFYNSRYAYGYTTDYIVAATPVTFFNGVQIRYIDTIEYATIYLNNNNVLSNFPGGLYYTFKQPIDHGLSVPTKSLYMYCFSEKPLIYNHDGGSLNFSNFNSQTTHLDIKFNSQYAPQIQSEFSLNMYYYGYINLEIANGRAKRL
jgi:hypothetical protein